MDLFIDSSCLYLLNFKLSLRFYLLKIKRMFFEVCFMGRYRSEVNYFKIIAQSHQVFQSYNNWIIVQQKMKKGTTNINIARYTNVNGDNRKEDHFSYFQNLQQKLLNESEKLTSLISVFNPTSESRSLQNSAISSNSTSKTKLLRGKMQDKQPSADIQGQKESKPLCFSLQNYLLRKKNILFSSKSRYFAQGKEEKDGESQMQRKLTYNLVHPADQAPSEQANIKELSPGKCEKNNENLKKTASSTNSAVLKTIDKIKRIHNIGSRKSVNLSKFKGLSIQDFKIFKYLQEGQFGSVYLAIHNQTKFISALKKIPKKIFDGQVKFINQLIRQIKIQSYLDHPNIIQLYGFFSDEEFLYLILEPCCGGNLYSSLKKQGRFSEDTVKTMARQICHAIQYMHDNDIIHRDIKPENILLHEEIIKVCDFGWSIHSPLLRDTRCGTPLYSSPEVVQKQQYDNKVDVWNIGILTYELLYGRVPFQIRSEDDLIKVVDQEIYFPKGVTLSYGAKDFILKCLHKIPKERVSMAKLVDHSFIQL